MQMLVDSFGFVVSETFCIQILMLKIPGGNPPET